MMRVQVWIRDEDLTEWQQIGNKSQWIHDQLTDAESDFERRMRRIAREVFEELIRERGGF